MGSEKNISELGLETDSRKNIEAQEQPLIIYYYSSHGSGSRREKFLGYHSKPDKGSFQQVGLKSLLVEPIRQGINGAKRNEKQRAFPSKHPSRPKQVNIYHRKISEQRPVSLSRHTSTNTFENDEPISLYEELFPEEEAKLKLKEMEKKAILKMETLPIFNWKFSKRNLRNMVEEAREDTVRVNQIKAQLSDKPVIDQFSNAIYEKMSLLSLNACSFSLEESDFLRMGPRGEHIETWISGLVKVIAIRDKSTLRSQRSYFILFSSDDAARAYHEKAHRLHRLSRLKNKGHSLTIPAKSADLREGEVLDDLLQNFSLVPSYSNLSLHMIKRPYKPRIKQILREGGPVANLRCKTLTEHMVLFYLDVGNISKNDLQQFIREDGKRRNIYWKLTGGNNAVLQIKQDEDPEIIKTMGVTNKIKPGFVKPSTYVIPFEYEYEARRFVRDWHRRRFPFRHQSKNDNYHPLINAELMW